MDDGQRMTVCIVYGGIGGIARCAVMRSGSNLMGNAINCNPVQFGGGSPRSKTGANSRVEDSFVEF